MWSWCIATVGEPAVGIGGCDLVDYGRERNLECLFGAGCRGAQQSFQLAPGLLDGVEVRGVGRQEEEATSGAFDQRADLVCFMRSKVVQDHHLPGPECRDENVAYKGDRDRCICGQRDRHAGNQALETEPTQQGQLRPAPGGRTPVGPLPDGRSSVAPRHRGADSALIHKDQIRPGNRRDLLPEMLPCLDHIRAALFTRLERFFLRLIPSRRRILLTVAG